MVAFHNRCKCGGGKAGVVAFRTVMVVQMWWREAWDKSEARQKYSGRSAEERQRGSWKGREDIRI